MPLTDRTKAQDGGFAQVREALVAFEGDVVAKAVIGGKEVLTEFGQWGGKLIDENTGKPVPPREYFQVACINVVPTEVTEELSMDISEGLTFRENCSNFKGSFWVDQFLLSADKAKVLIPDGLIGKRVAFRKFTLEADDPKFNSTNYIIEKIISTKATPKVVQKADPVIKQAATPPDETPAEEATDAADPMEIARKIAIGKTEMQFRSAIALDPTYAGSPLLSLAKSGSITTSLVSEGKLVLVKEGNKEVYREP